MLIPQLSLAIDARVCPKTNASGGKFGHDLCLGVVHMKATAWGLQVSWRVAPGELRRAHACAIVLGVAAGDREAITCCGHD